jgi:hypothetical protein
MATITITTSAPKRRETLRGLVQTALHREKENLQLALTRTLVELARFEKKVTFNFGEVLSQLPVGQAR